MTDFRKCLLIFNVSVNILALAKHVIDSNMDQIKRFKHGSNKTTNLSLSAKPTVFFKYITVPNLQRLA